MKTEAELRGRVRDLLRREMQRRVEASKQKLPHLCKHNYRHNCDTRKTVEGAPNENYNRLDARHLPLMQTMGLCMLGADNPEEWKGTICDEPIDAQRCPDFTPREDEPTVIAEFKAQVENPQWVEENLPEVTALLWAVGEAVQPEPEPEPVQAAESDPEPEPEPDPEPVELVVRETRQPWWVRWWRTIFGGCRGS